MDFATYRGFGDELSKIAFGEAEARVVSRIAKTRQLPAAAARSVGAALPAPIGFLNTPRLALRRMTAGAGAILGASKSELPVIRNINQQAIAASPEAAAFGTMSKRKSSKGAIFQHPRALSKMRQLAKPIYGLDLPTLKDPANNRMVNAIFKGHELDELGTKFTGVSSQQTYGHASPDVILREHNRVATLRPEHAPAKTYMQTLRGANEGSAFLAPFGMTYGESPRLSRHARRRMTQVLEREAASATPQELVSQVRESYGLSPRPL